MANLLDLVDQLIGDLLQSNVFTDTNPYRKNIIGSSVPEGAYRHIPNTDPRLLDLRSPVGFEHPHKEIAAESARRVMPPDPMHDNLPQYTNENGLIPGPKRQQIYQQTPPGQIPASVNDQAQSSIDRLIQQQARGEIYGPGGTVPTSVNEQAGALESHTIQQQARGEIYGPDGPVPHSIKRQQRSLQSNIIPRKDPPDQFLGEPFTNDQGQILADKSTPFYNNPSVGPQSQIEKLADFHERKTRPPTTTFTADKRAADLDFPFKTPADNPPPNDFVGVPSRPLNFRDGDEFVGTTRTKLAAGLHEQKVGWNSELGASPQPHGLTENNLYKDTELENFQGPYRGPAPQPLNYTNVFAAANWLRNIATELSIVMPDGTSGLPPGEPVPERVARGISFLASQALLASFNPANPENGSAGNAIYNPLSIMAAVPFVAGAPFVGEATNITAGAAISTYKNNVLTAESANVSRLLLAREGLYSEVSPIHRASKFHSPVAEPGFIGNTVGPGPGDTLDNQQRDQLPSTLSTISAQVDGGLKTEAVRKLGVHTNIYTADNPYNAQSAIFPLEKAAERAKLGEDPATGKLSTLFDAVSRGNGSVFGLGSKDLLDAPDLGKPVLADWVVKPLLFDAGISQTSLADAPGLNAGIVEAAVPFEGEDGFVPERPLSGDEIYLDLMFRDLRDPAAEYLYFRAFLKGDINETFTPEWQTNRYYGRVDQVPIYKGTTRTLNFTFDVAAFQYSDLSVIWRKLSKLQSLVYPTFNVRGFLNQGPLIRLKIGDLFAGESNQGLPGYITGMDWSFPDGIWNIEKDFKVPRLITVAISYTVVHDGNPGIYPLQQWDLDTDGETVTNDAEGRTFGTARIEEQGDGTTRFKISAAEIRKIFSQVKNN